MSYFPFFKRKSLKSSVIPDKIWDFDSVCNYCKRHDVTSVVRVQHFQNTFGEKKMTHV